MALLRHHAVTMEIAIRSNVHHDLEPQIGVLERPSDFLPPGRPLEQISLENLTFLCFVETSCCIQCLIPNRMRFTEEESRQDLRLRFRIVFNKAHLGLEASFKLQGRQ